MKRQLKKEDLARLYREFSRQKYNKYKHQYPRMRESELVSKIIKEWEALSSQEKDKLFESYTAEKHITEEKSDSSDKPISPGSSKSKKKKLIEEKQTSKGPGIQTETPKKSGVRILESSSSKKDKDQISQSSDFARDGVKKDFEISESVSKQKEKLGAAKKKKISKGEKHQPKTEYLKFFKFYYDKLIKEHPRWTANQTAIIIKLLWKKKRTTDRQESKGLIRAPRGSQRMSGRMAFRKHFNYSNIEVYQRWKQLPVESKNFWKKKGQGQGSGKKRVLPALVKFPKLQRKLSESSNTSLSVNFLKRIMV